MRHIPNFPPYLLSKKVFALDEFFPNFILLMKTWNYQLTNV
jgi:hypothetical protein